MALLADAGYDKSDIPDLDLVPGREPVGSIYFYREIFSERSVPDVFDSGFRDEPLHNLVIEKAHIPAWSSGVSVSFYPGGADPNGFNRRFRNTLHRRQADSDNSHLLQGADIPFIQNV